MGTFSLWHWIILLVILAPLVWMTSRITRKAGLSGWWAVLTVVPVVNPIVLWVFAFAKWPNLPGR